MSFDFGQPACHNCVFAVTESTQHTRVCVCVVQAEGGCHGTAITDSILCCNKDAAVLSSHTHTHTNRV